MHDMEVDDEENMYARMSLLLYVLVKTRNNQIQFLCFRSENDEETLSETKIRLDDDDEGYDDDGQGIFCFFVETVLFSFLCVTGLVLD